MFSSCCCALCLQPAAAHNGGGDGYITGESAAKLAVKEYLKNSAVCSTLQHGGAQITVHPQDGGGSYEDASEDATVLVPGGGKKARVTDGPDGMP